jgi:hypothetical protein
MAETRGQSMELIREGQSPGCNNGDRAPGAVRLQDFFRYTWIL